MTTILTDSANYTAIANAIRTQLGVQTTYLPSEMAAAILTISGGGGDGDADPSTVTWANGSWADIADLLSQHYAGTIDLTNYWSVGDTRSVSLSAMSATGVGEAHAAQTVELVIMAAKHYDMSDNSGKAAFVIGQKNSLEEVGYMQDPMPSTTSWDSCPRRTWCNQVYKNALPSELKSLVKQVNIVTATQNGKSTTQTSADYCFLLAEKEVEGSSSAANSTAESGLSQYAWYSAGNKVKKLGASGSNDAWWLRSPHKSYAQFVRVYTDGATYPASTDNTFGIAPHFCI